MYNFIYSIFNIYMGIFDYFLFGSFSISEVSGEYSSIVVNLFNNDTQLYLQYGNSIAFNLSMLCTIITLILLLYMVYKICKLIICRIANV